MLPPLRRAFDPLGPIKPEIASVTGLAPETQVFCGVHDSNAALLPYLVSRKAPFTVLSTGTWVILMCVGLSLDQLDPRDDTLANIDALGQPTACGRFMGGREYAVIEGGGGNPDLATIERVIAFGAVALPCFSGQGGPYATTKGAIVTFTKALSELLIEKGIRVNAVAPGPVWTPLIPSTMPQEKVKQFGANSALKVSEMKFG